LSSSTSLHEKDSGPSRFLKKLTLLKRNLSLRQLQLKCSYLGLRNKCIVVQKHSKGQIIIFLVVSQEGLVSYKILPWCVRMEDTHHSVMGDLRPPKTSRLNWGQQIKKIKKVIKIWQYNVPISSIVWPLLN